jgi:hypothetical protein
MKKVAATMSDFGALRTFRNNQLSPGQSPSIHEQAIDLREGHHFVSVSLEKLPDLGQQPCLGEKRIGPELHHVLQCLHESLGVIAPCDL